MKTITTATVVSQKQLSRGVKLLEIFVPAIAEQAQPGQFVNVRVSRQSAPLLRRPFGVAAVNQKAGTISIIYRLLGEGTRLLADYRAGDMLSVIGPLGNGFALNAAKPLLVGGGLGLAPLLYLAAAYGTNATVLMGGRSHSELFWTELFASIAQKIYLTTDDGSLGVQGTVMAILPQLLASGKFDGVFVCGPVPMMKAVAAACQQVALPCQVSLEKYMACGLGACLSCSFQGRNGRLKVCKDGPVFLAEEVLEW